jgi:hypothetical protein
MRILTLILILLLGNIHTLATPADLSGDTHFIFSSGELQVNLLELYTSEGCSSCPPAEAWFSTLLDRPDLWRRIVPVVFHVDYWNDLGWQDPFSTPDNSQRQRRYQAEGGVRSVYTPGFVLNGREWRDWFSGADLPDNSTAAGLLNVEVTNGQIQATYRNDQHTVEPLELHIALLGFDLSTKVARGENRSKTLTHQFVVLQQTTALSDRNEWTLALPHSATGANKHALAIWVTLPKTQRPLQATGGWLQ